MATNKSIGNTFETELCEILGQHGFWAHNMAQNAAGQPADVIAVKDKLAYLIDCKVCTKERFQLSRIEENQHLAMSLWSECGNGYGWFAIRVDNEIFMIAFPSLIKLSRRQSSLNPTEIRECGVRLERWLTVCT